MIDSISNEYKIILYRISQIINGGKSLIDSQLLSVEAEHSEANPEEMSQFSLRKSEEGSLYAERIATVAKKHMIDIMLGQDSQKSKWQAVLMGEERERLAGLLEAAGIDYRFLKGSIWCKLYPNPYMRQMMDCDILTADDAKITTKVADILLADGYERKKSGCDNHEVFFKRPVYEVEVHRSLFDEKDEPKLYSYFSTGLWQNGKDGKLPKWSAGMEFLYMLAHHYKHFSCGEMGIRHLIDIYLYERKYSNLYDEEWLQRELENLNIGRFASDIRELAHKVFNNEHELLSDKQKEMLDHICDSGVFGSYESRVRGKLMTQDTKTVGQAKRKYLFKRIFPPIGYYEKNAPFCFRHRWAIPFFGIYRVFRILFARRSRLKTELQTLHRKD